MQNRLKHAIILIDKTKRRHQSSMKDPAQIVAIYGKQGSGKDYLADRIKTEFNKTRTVYVQLSFAGPLRDELNTIVKAYIKEPDLNKLSAQFDTPRYTLDALFHDILKDEDLSQFDAYVKTPTTRTALQFWGTDIRRNQDDHYWLTKLKEDIDKQINDDKRILITDCRFDNEFELLHNLGAKFIYRNVPKETRIKRLEERDGFKPSKEQLNHASEKDITNKYPDRTIVLSGTTDINAYTIKDLMAILWN